MKERPALIYILSNGRSGSTLLDLLLGAHPAIWTLGEAQVLPWEFRREGALCGCGTPIRNCEFWLSAAPKIPIGIGRYPIEHFTDKNRLGKVLRWDQLPGLLQREASKKWLPAIEEYGRLNAQYFDAVRQAAEIHTGNRIHWLVDASKDIYRLFWLQNSGFFELRVIHLMKDPRAFVYSMVKRYLPEVSSKTIRYTGRWVVENILFSHFCRGPLGADKTFRLRYDELAGRPGETLTALGNWLGHKFPSDLHENFREAESHALMGNRMRWQNTGVFLDEKWRNSFPRKYSRTIWLLTWFLARSYGYR